MPSWAEVLGNRPMGRKKALGVPWGCKPLQASLALAGGLLRLLGAVIQAAVLAVLHTVVLQKLMGV